MGKRRAFPAALAALLLAAAGSPAPAQPENPVYVDDSPVAAATFDGLPALLAAGNVDEGARALQALLDTQAERLVQAGDRPGLFRSVRQAVHERLLGSPDLLARYRELHAERAARLLADGDAAAVERSLLLTPSGFEAALRVAQQHLEEARFEAARLTLEQLEHHPEAQGQDLADAALMLARVARYLGRSDVSQLALAWAERAGAEAPAMEAVDWPPGAARHTRTPLDAVGPISVDGVLARPLWSQFLHVPDAPEGRQGRNEGYPPNARQLWIMPAVVGDTLLVVDGQSISAYNRYTLSPIWSVQPPYTPAPESSQRISARARLSRTGTPGLEDPGVVSAAGRTAAAVIGRAADGSREGDERLHAIDLDSGVLRWSVSVEDAHPDLAGASVRGRPIITEGLVIVGARKYLVDRRLMSIYLVAFHEQTGELAWRRLIGSAGSLPWSRMPAASHDGTLHEGIVYRSDRLGVIGAYEAVTGRPLWIRRLPSDETGVSSAAWPWHVVTPIVHDGTVIVLTPSETEIVQLDAATGRQIASRSAAHFGAPRYLVSSGSHLVAVGEAAVHVTPLNDFAGQTPPRESQPFEGAHIRGRVVPAGDRLVVPVETGVALVDLKNPAADPKMVKLDQPGNVLPDEGQLLVVDDTRVHSYLLWEEAEARLTAKMAETPQDPGPAITLAELAFRAGRPQSVLPAADAAIRAIGSRPTAPEIDAERRRLFAVLHTMVAAGQEPGFDGRLGDLERISDPALLEQIIHRLAAIANTADERVTHRLALGRYKESVADPVQAAAEYQRVLDDDELSSAIWRGPSLSVRADLEATRRIERLVNDYGPSVYAMQESEAHERFLRLGEAASEDELLALAMQYPVATLTPRLWMQVAERRTRAGDAHGAIAALESGMTAAGRIANVPDESVAEIAGRLTSALLEQDRVSAAMRLLEDFAGRRPGLAPTQQGQPLDLAALRSDLDQRLAALHRWPIIGDSIEERPQVLPGWVVLQPLFEDRLGEVNSCVVLENGDRVAVFAPRPAQEGPLEEIWSHATGGRASQPLRVDADAAYLFLPTEDGAGIVEKVPLTDGVAGWRTAPVRRLLQAAEKVRNDTLETPLDGRVHIEDLVATMDERTLVLSERRGRAVAIDLTTGQMLWSGPVLLSQVHDAVIGAGRLCISGEREVADPTAPPGTPVVEKPHVVVLDARSGRVLQQHEAEGAGRARWVRVSEAGDLIVGFDRAIRSIDLRRAQTNWTVRNEQVRDSRAAWTFFDRLFILTGDDTLLLASVADGRLREEPLDLIDATQQGLRRGRIDLFAAGPGRVVLAMPQGIVIYDEDGNVLGADAVTELESMLTASPAAGRAVTMDIVAAGRRADENLIFMLHQIGTDSGMLVSSVPVALGAAPQRLTLMDERIIVSAGAATVVYRAPISEAQKPEAAQHVPVSTPVKDPVPVP